MGPWTYLTGVNPKVLFSGVFQALSFLQNDSKTKQKNYLGLN
jgi:hypothetical protein